MKIKYILKNSKTSKVICEIRYYSNSLVIKELNKLQKKNRSN